MKLTSLIQATPLLGMYYNHLESLRPNPADDPENIRGYISAVKDTNDFSTEVEDVLDMYISAASLYTFAEIKARVEVLKSQDKN